MAVKDDQPKKRLADYGLNSERILMTKVGAKKGEPGAFETELGDLEERLMLTTVSKAVALGAGRVDVARHLRARVLRD